MTLNPFAAFNTWWERYRLTHPRLHIADVTFDQSHTWHALFCAIAGVVAWALLGWWLDARAWAFGVLGAIATYAVYELAWRIPVLLEGILRRGMRAELDAVGGSHVTIRYEQLVPAMRWWDGLLDIGKPLWAPGCLALAVLFGDVPTWIVALFAGLTFAIAYAYAFGRPSGALYYDGTY